MKKGFQVYLDMDGVLADFDRRAIEIVGIRPRDFEDKNGVAALWDKIDAYPGFFASLDLMPDAMELWEGVYENFGEPIILTGTPKREPIRQQAAEQKVVWAKKNFGSSVKIITCLSAEKKHVLGERADVLVDDWHKYMHLWEGAGGKFILHTSAEKSLKELADHAV